MTTICCSGNEIDAMVKRAMRGVGASWGLAEEAGKSASWLACHGLTSASVMQTLAMLNDGEAYENLRPRIADGVWTASGGRLCPIATGAALADLFDLICTGPGVELRDVSCPVILVPFVGRASAMTGGVVTLQWDGAAFEISNGNVAVIDGTASDVAQADVVKIAPEPAFNGTALAYQAGDVPVDAEIWQQLNTLAYRTFVPDSAASRLAGAGAGLTDND